MATSNPVFKEYRKINNHDYLSTESPATVTGVLNKTTISLAMVIVVGAVTFMTLPLELLKPISIVTAIGAFVTAWFVASRPKVTPLHVGVYSLIEGVFMGAITLLFETLFPGIAFQAVLATIIVASVTFLVFRSGAIRVTNRFRQIVSIATLSLAAVYFLNLILSLFSVHTGIVEIGPNAGMLSWVVSAIAVGLATFNLVIDFDSTQKMIANRAPASEEWRAAFGLMVTLVWLYFELLRVLSYFRD